MRTLDALRRYLAARPRLASVLLAGALFCVSVAGLAALCTGLREPSTTGGALLSTLGAAALLACCWVADASVPVGRG